MKWMEEKENLNQLKPQNNDVELILSYSKISDFDRNGAVSLVRKTNVDNNGTKLGSVVDDLLFLDKKQFNENYLRFNGNKPASSLGMLCDLILKNYIKLPTKEEVLNIIKINKFWGNIKNEELLISKFDNAEFWDYLNIMFESLNKQIITEQEYNNALELVTILKTHDYSKDILINNFENYYQVKFDYIYNSIKIRGIIDIVTINHENKTITLTDLKTGKNPSYEFETSFIKWRYYFQGALYVRVFDELYKALNLKDYTLNDFQFLYISLSDKIPLVFKMTDKWINAAYKGFKINDTIYRGIDELLENIVWCHQNKEYIISKEVFENNGIVKLKDNYININES